MSDKPICLETGPFSARCYALLLQIPSGKVTTYGEMARALGTRAYRAVGQAMHRNPNAPEVPCHRVIRSDGLLGGYAGGPEKKACLLMAEGIPIRNGAVMNLSEFFYKFPRSDVPL